jgi:hypothetical protein
MEIQLISIIDDWRNKGIWKGIEMQTINIILIICARIY